MVGKRTVIEIKTGDTETLVDQKLGREVNWSRYIAAIGRDFPPKESLDTFLDLSNTAYLEMKVNIEGHLYDINLPDKMMARLSRYLADVNYPFDKGGFDCACFVHWMIDAPYEFKDLIGLSKYEMEKLKSDWDVKPGDVIHMNAADNWASGISAEHAMVYIGHGLFLSKQGERRGLSVQKLYQLRDVWRL